MNVSLFNRRRAERLAQLIDDPASLVAGRHHGRSALDDELAALVSLTRRVSDLPMTAEAHPEFREGLRAVLMATIEREGIGITAKPEEKSDGRTLLAAAAAEAERRRARMRTRVFGSAVAGLAASALALSGVSVASGNALPGQALYGVKRSTERAQLALTGSDNDRASLYLDFASTRLDEARSVIGDHDQFEKSITDWQDDATEGVRLLTAAAFDARNPAVLDPIDAFVTDERPVMTKLAKQVSDADRPLVEDAADLLDRIAARSAALRRLVTCGTSAAGKEDDLGPTPGTPCASTNSTTSSGSDGASKPPSTKPSTHSTPPSTPPAGGTKPGTDTAPAGPPADNPSNTISGGSLTGDFNNDMGNVNPTG